jgi:hypothetical protein
MKIMKDIQDGKERDLFTFAKYLLVFLQLIQLMLIDLELVIHNVSHPKYEQKYFI